MRITVSENGPYFVEGGVPLLRAEIVVNEQGEATGWRELGRIDAGESYMLCRCGESHARPFCDFTHVSIGFDGTETAGHASFMELAVDVGSPDLPLHDARNLCAEARFCDRAGGLWNLVKECDDPAIRALVVEEAGLCPSGRYVACDREGVPTEPEYEPSIVLVEDPQLGVSGPIFVRGGVEVVDSAGQPYEIRNRVTLCRCGQSANRPFCDGNHIAAGFREHL